MVLELLAESEKARKKVGRNSISEGLERRGLYLSPQEVRTIVKIQQAYGLVNILSGRGGTEISPLGRQLLPLLLK
jgi:repressor of nif and glnA expression